MHAYNIIILYNTLQGVWDKLAEMFLYSFAENEENEFSEVGQEAG